MNGLDWLVLLGTMLGIAVYGIWRTRGRRDLSAYLKGKRDTKWFVIGLSVMATQASSTTFLSTPGQGYESGIGFVQNYFGAPFALIVIAIFFVPLYRRLNVYTAYEFLGKRFDTKTRLLGVALFLIQRGIGAGLTIYAPAIVLSTVMGWRLDLTIVASGMVVIIYTVSGGTDAVSHTQKYQIGVIFAGMITAFVLLIAKLPANLHFTDALAVAGTFQKLNAVDYSPDIHKRYTLWSGLFGGLFLALAYFGTDQSQVQRYISGASVRESRLGLMFNAVCKIPMQFFILMLGAMLFVFYQFEKPPVIFDQTTWHRAEAIDGGAALRAVQIDFDRAHAEKQAKMKAWIDARHSGNGSDVLAAKAAAIEAHQQTEAIRATAKKSIADNKANDADYIFITFIVNYLPHGLIGLLVAVFFAAALSSKAGELNALGSTTTVDIYRHVIRTDATDRHYVIASKCFTVWWGLFAIGIAYFANLSENLIQAGNILGSVLYGAPLGLFLIAFFVRSVGGTAAFIATLIAQALVIIFYYTLTISYLWYNLIGCVICIALAICFQFMIGREPAREPIATS